MTLTEDAPDTAVPPEPPQLTRRPIRVGPAWADWRGGLRRLLLARSRPAPAGSTGTGVWVASTVTVLAAWFLLHALLLTGFQERSDQARLYGQFRQELAEETAPLGGVIGQGSPVALLSTGPGIHNEVVVEGTSSAQLTAGPGHLAGSPLPGQSGVSVLFGRSLTYGGPFGSVPSMKPGDAIKVVTGQGSFTYRVTSVRRPGSPLPRPLRSGQSRLTLVTSSSSGWPGGWGAHVVYVDALLAKGKIQPSSTAAVHLSSDSLPMRGDSTHLTALVFWLQALLIAVVAAAWAWVRWGLWPAWIAGVPLVMAALWGATGAVELLLPNLV